MRLDRLLHWLTGVELVVACLWIGLAAITVTLLVLMHTRWGQSHPLRKCLILSLIAHALFATYATTVEIAFVQRSAPHEKTIRVAVIDTTGEIPQSPPAAGSHSTPDLKPWETFSDEPAAVTEPSELARATTATPPEVLRQTGAEPRPLPLENPADRLPLSDTARPQPKDLPPTQTESAPAEVASPQPIDVPAAQRRDLPKTAIPSQPPTQHAAKTDVAAEPPTRTTQSGMPSALLHTAPSTPRLDDTPAPAEPERALASGEDPRMQPTQGSSAAPLASELYHAAAPAPVDSRIANAVSVPAPSLAASGADPLDRALAGTTTPMLPLPSRNLGQDDIPEIYQLRVAPDRSRQIAKHGATGETEEAVQAALKWLADNQAANGAWVASAHGAGQERFVNGRDRLGAGAGADTGMTGLALLTFLAAGNTSKQGKYQATVGRGIDYLLAMQASNGNLAGNATEYAAMYCHAMATLALSEAYAMTHDPRLHQPVGFAVAYTVSMQNPATGGWRYRRGDDGDTSQLGWQLMALKSAELAGIPIPPATWQGAARFLRSVSSGRYGGLGSYRPGEQVSVSMTAEALVCRQFLGLSPHSPTAREAADYLMRELPDQSNPPNEYYWYYGTLGTYQLQDSHWQRWNESLKQTLLSSQRKDGSMAGSWNTNTMWGGYGGRVYTTAMATLSLEVYYRYLPLYERAENER